MPRRDRELPRRWHPEDLVAGQAVVRIATPPDRDSHFEPELVCNGRLRLTGLDEKISAVTPRDDRPANPSVVTNGMTSCVTSAGPTPIIRPRSVAPSRCQATC